jgi:hypothetical protein
MVNTFNWTQIDFALNSMHIYNGNNSIRSPFFDTDNSFIGQFYDPIPGPKDYLPDADGWELIKKDFGFEIGGTPVNNPYFILYNKYRGTLRIFVARGDQALLNGAMLKMKFIDLTPMQTSLLDHASELIPINGQFIPFPKLNSSANILNGYEEWFYADFPMHYDPCTCLYQSKVEIRVDLSNTSMISLKGGSNGEIVTQGAPSPQQSDKGSFSIGELGSLAKKTHNTYKSLVGFKNDVIAKGGSSTAVTNLSNELKKSDFLRTGLSALPFVGSALAIVDFFTSGGRKSTAPQEVSVMPMSITMTTNYTGSITTDYPYSPYITFRTPGSNPGTAPDSEYPYYNEVLGVLNLMYMPKINVQKSQRVVSRSLNQGGPYLEYTNKYRFAEPLQYVLNPAAGLVVEEIKAMIILEARQLVGGGDMGVNATTSKYEAAIPLVDFGCLTNTIRTVTWTSLSTLTIPPSDNVRIKVIANLRRTDATTNTQNVLFVATFPATQTIVTNIGTVGSCTNPLQLPLTSSVVQNYCTSPAYLNSGRFPANRKYDDLVKELEASEQKYNKSNEDNDFSIYPNPVKGNTTIKYKLNYPSLVTISIVNSMGIKKQYLTEVQDTGDHITNIDLSEYQPGIYIAILEINGSKKIERIIIQN